MPSLFTATDPKFHQSRRRLLAPFFAEASVEGFQPIILDRVRMLIGKVREDFKKNGTADMYQWWTLMALDIMGELSFGESFRMLESGKVRMSRGDFMINYQHSLLTAFYRKTSTHHTSPTAPPCTLSERHSRL
jgi:cytochrome P450